MAAAAAKPYDILILGASGFTGKLVAEYFLTNYGVKPADFKWGVAGRNRAKLESVAKDLQADLPIVVANNDDIESLKQLAQQTRVCISLVGPYHKHGSLLVEACAAAGTHLVDLTGESTWVHEMITKHHETAVKSGAKIIPSCGFDCIPADIGTFIVAEHLRKKHNCSAAAVTYYLGKMSATGASGGTIASVKGIAEQAWQGGRSYMKKLTDPYLLCPADARPDYSNPGDGGGFGYRSELGAWGGPFIFAGHDSKIVHRSNALLGGRYGRLQYREVLRFRGRVMGLLPALLTSAATALATLCFYLPLTRRLLMPLLPVQGEGPSREKMDAGFFWVKLLGRGEDGSTVLATVGTDKGDCGYKGTAIMLAESALTLALTSHDEMPVKGGGILTTATMGMPFVERLQKAGIVCTVEDIDASSSSSSSKQD